MTYMRQLCSDSVIIPVHENTETMEIDFKILMLKLKPQKNLLRNLFSFYF